MLTVTNTLISCLLQVAMILISEGAEVNLEILSFSPEIVNYVNEVVNHMGNYNFKHHAPSVSGAGGTKICVGSV